MTEHPPALRSEYPLQGAARIALDALLPLLTEEQRTAALDEIVDEDSYHLNFAKIEDVECHCPICEAPLERDPPLRAGIVPLQAEAICNECLGQITITIDHSTRGSGYEVQVMTAGNLARTMIESRSTR